jgi:phage head maturation protease
MSEKAGRRLNSQRIGQVKRLSEAMQAVMEEMADFRKWMDYEDGDDQDGQSEPAKAVTKKEGDGDHPASHYLVVEDGEKPTTWHLRVKGPDGKPDHRLMGAAWAALHGGYRGNVYEGPNKQEAIAKLKRLYDEEGMEPPGSKSLTVKALGDDRIGSYAVLWGTADETDVTGEYFTTATAELDAVFKAVGKLPVLYHHAGDDALKTTVVGVVDTLKADDVGMWYEAQLALAGQYREAIKELVKRGALGTSSGTYPRARKAAPDGRIERWPIAEVSLTPTPAEPRMMERPVAEIKAAFTEIGLTFPEAEDGARGDEESRRVEAEREAALLDLISMEVLT